MARTKGSLNKHTWAIKQAILNAFTKVGGEDYLVNVAKEDPKTFCTLLGRVLPSEMKVEGNVNINLIDILNERIKRIEHAGTVSAGDVSADDRRLLQ